MAFAGVANAKDRADLVAYLKSKWAAIAASFSNLLLESDFLIILENLNQTNFFFSNSTLFLINFTN